MSRSFTLKVFLCLFIFCISSTGVLAASGPIQIQVDQAIPHGRFQLGVGSHLSLQFPGAKHVTPGIFLGRLIEPGGVFSKYMILDEEKSKIELASKDNVQIANYTFQPILRQYDQVGGTCTGFAIDHLLQQLYWSGFPGNGLLRTTLSDEKGRTQLLVDAINQYYLVTQHRYSIAGIMKQYGVKFGLTCEKKMFTDAASASNYLIDRMGRGLPVLISYNIGTAMVDSPYEIEDYESPAPMKDKRLWIPRKIGDRNTGGHSVIAAAVFESNHRNKMLMLDSDWAEPRVWDMEEYLGNRTAISEIEFHTCW